VAFLDRIDDLNDGDDAILALGSASVSGTRSTT